MSTTTMTGWRSPWRDLSTNLSRNRRGMLIAFLSSSCLFGTAALLMPAMYKSESVLMIRLGPEYLVNADPANTAAYEENRLIEASEVAMLTAPELITQVIQEIGLEHIYPKLAAEIDPAQPQTRHDAMERALIKFSKHLAALPGKESTLIGVTYAHTDPEIAGQVLHRLVEDYLQMRRKHFEYANGDALSTALQATTDRLDTATRRLDNFRRHSAITDFDTQSLHLFNEQAELVAVRDKALVDIPDLTAQATALRGALDKIGTSAPLRREVSESEALREVKVADAQLHLKENELRLSYKPGTPQLADAARHIMLTEPLLNAYAQMPTLSTTMGRPQSYDGIQVSLEQAMANLSGSQARLQAANAQLEEVSRSIMGLNAGKSTLHQLEREQKIAEDAYFQAGRRVTEAAAHDQMMEAAKPNVEIVQAARVPFKETATRMIVAALGVVLGVIFASVLAYVDDMGRARALPGE